MVPQLAYFAHIHAKYLANICFHMFLIVHKLLQQSQSCGGDPAHIRKRPLYSCIKEKLSQKRSGLLSHAASNCFSYPFSLTHFQTHLACPCLRELWMLRVCMRPRRTETVPERELHWTAQDRESSSGSGSSLGANSCIWESHMSFPSPYMFSCGLLLSLLETAHWDRSTFGLRQHGRSCIHRRLFTGATRVLLLQTSRLQKRQQSAHFTAGYWEPLSEWPSILNQAESGI